MGERLVIRGARLFDGRGADPIDGAVLVAEDDRIVYAGPWKGAPSFADATTIDAEGRALLPGLIDCHVHLCFDGVADFEREAGEMNPARGAVKAVSNAQRHLEAGVTTVRDLGGIGSAVIDFAWAQRRGMVAGARVLTAGEVLTITGGHAHFIGVEVDSAADLVREMRRLKKSGADLIKLIATGGVLTRGVSAQRSAFSVEQMAAAVNEAHEAELRVAAHAIGAAGIEGALQAGVDSIEHGCFITEEALKLFVGNPSWLVATLVAPHKIRYGGEGVPEFAVRKSDEVMGAHRESFRRAVEAGVRIASGTDAGTPFNPHGNLPLELRLMHEAGMPLGRVLVAATSEAASLLGLDDIGVLEPGRIADAVLLEGDPLADVGAYARPAIVVQGGRVAVDRS